MARIRTVKPEFWTSEQVVECSASARLLFVGMWNFCDDSGVHPANIMRLKMEVFPADNLTRQELAAMVQELCDAKLLESYLVSGSEYWRVTGWKHQKIDKPSYKFPLPDGRIPDSSIPRRKLQEDSSNGRGVVGEDSPAEGSLREGNVINQKPSRAKRELPIDIRHEPVRQFIEKCCLHAKVPLQWDGSEASALSKWLTSAGRSLTVEAICELIRSRFRSTGEPLGDRPRLWIPNLGRWAQGPTNQFKQPSESPPEDKTPDINAVKEQQRQQAKARGG